jgi:hypothetical protein
LAPCASARFAAELPTAAAEGQPNRGRGPADTGSSPGRARHPFPGPLAAGRSTGLGTVSGRHTDADPEEGRARENADRAVGDSRLGLEAPEAILSNPVGIAGLGESLGLDTAGPADTTALGAAVRLLEWAASDHPFLKEVGSTNPRALLAGDPLSIAESRPPSCTKVAVGCRSVGSRSVVRSQANSLLRGTNTRLREIASGRSQRQRVATLATV